MIFEYSGEFVKNSSFKKDEKAHYSEAQIYLLGQLIDQFFKKIKINNILKLVYDLLYIKLKSIYN